jgi:hypothetical protein
MAAIDPILPILGTIDREFRINVPSLLLRDVLEQEYGFARLKQYICHWQYQCANCIENKEKNGLMGLPEKGPNLKW